MEPGPLWSVCLPADAVGTEFLPPKVCLCRGLLREEPIAAAIIMLLSVNIGIVLSSLSSAKLEIVIQEGRCEVVSALHVFVRPAITGGKHRISPCVCLESQPSI